MTSACLTTDGRRAASSDAAVERNLDRRSIEGYGFILDIEIAYKFCVRGDEIVDAIHFNAVTGVINHGYIGISRSLGKFAEDAP